MELRDRALGATPVFVAALHAHRKACRELAIHGRADLTSKPTMHDEFRKAVRRGDKTPVVARYMVKRRRCHTHDVAPPRSPCRTFAVVSRSASRMSSETVKKREEQQRLQELERRKRLQLDSKAGKRREFGRVMWKVTSQEIQRRTKRAF